MDTDTKPRPPRFNHVAMSVPADLIDEAGRKELVAFYQDVFGWEEQPYMTKDRHILVLQCHRYDQFVFLIADESPMACPSLDHFGMSVGTVEELDAMLARAKAYQEHDDRVKVIEKKVEPYDPGPTLTSFYVGYLLPMMVEIQHYDWHHGG
jgi:hypothetical protein